MKITLPLIHLDNLVFSPLPQLALKAYAVEHGICEAEEIEIIEFSREDDVANSMMQILNTKPQIVGFSCYVWNFLVVEKLSRAIEEVLGEDCLVVWGGPHVSEQPALFAKRYPQSVDLVVGWYGEKSFSEIINLYRANHSVSEIARQVNGVWSVQTPEKPADMDFVPLNQLPNPHVYDFFPQTLKDEIDTRVFLVETYRNCPFQCGYCLWGQAENKINGLSAETVIEVFDSLISAGARHFKFADAGLGLMKKRDKEIFRHFIDNRIWELGVNLRTYYFWQTLDEEWCEIFSILIEKKVIGQLDIGIQTFNPDTLDAMKRPTNYKKFDVIMEMIQRWNLPYSIDLILGLPGDTLEGWKNSVRRVLSYEPRRYQSFLCSILPGTEYDLNRDKYGIKTIQGSVLDDDEKVIQTATFPLQDLMEALDIEAWLYFAFTVNLCSRTIKLLARETQTDLFDVVYKLMKWSKSRAPVMSTAISSYRDNLYDSRQKGRLEIETRILDNFLAISLELHAFIADHHNTSEIHDSLDKEFMTFPKTKSVVKSLVKAKMIEIDNDGSFYHQTRDNAMWRYSPPDDEPIAGVIGTKYSYWTWTPQRVSAV